ncbi:MAG: hypothetical protein QM831_31500 [Kofleriaceae bacterium]
MEETNAHKKMWNKRGEIQRQIQSVMTGVIDDIESIIDGSDDA